MKFIGKSLLILSVCGLSFSALQAKTLTVNFDRSSVENYQLDAVVSENSLTLSQERSSPQYCREASIENIGHEIICDCLPFVDKPSFFTLNTLAERLAHDKAPLMALIHFWQSSVIKDHAGQSDLNCPHPLYCLNFLGACSSKDYTVQFKRLCHALGIDTRLANMKGKKTYDFCFKGDDWSLVDLANDQIYLGWDNETLVSSEALMDDPLLMLRTKPQRFAEGVDFSKAWQELARLNIIHQACSAEELHEQMTFENQAAGFTLYPKEKLIYSRAGSDHRELSPYNICVKQTVDWQAREKGGAISYASPFPIFEIFNGTSAVIYLKDQQIELQPNTAHRFEGELPFEIEATAANGGTGHLIVSTLCSWKLFPVLHKGTNAIYLGSEKNNSLIALTYDLNEQLENPLQPIIDILNHEDEFSYCAPRFFLGTSAQLPADQIWWQISADAQFKTIPSNLEHIQPFVEEVSLDTLTETFLNPDQIYYFRVKGGVKSAWGNWSDVFAFTVKKPLNVDLVEFEKVEEGLYEMDWTREAEESETPIEYLVFGSNSLDFIPSIYCPGQVAEVLNGKAVLEANNNLVEVTTSTRITVDGALAYYRIVARKNGQLSVPSPIVHVYDCDLVQPRNVLQEVESDRGESHAKRMMIPTSYPWTEAALPRLGIETRTYKNSLLELHEIIASSSELSGSTSAKGYVKPRKVPEEIWNKVKKYFLPENHPWKAKVDRIFAKTRVTLDPVTLAKAGFKGRVGRVSFVYAGTHPDAQECFFKIYCDAQLQMRMHDYQKWINRVEGKEAVKACIKKYGLEEMFSVPSKFIYPLPEEPACPKSARFLPKSFILVGSNQRPYEHSENEKMYHSKMNKKRMDAFFILLDEAGMWDSCFAFNVPFCKVDGKQCFLDTEYHHKWPIRYEKLNRYFSKEGQAYWNHLIKNGGPKGYDRSR